jgi:hypothetical protein
MPCTLWQARVKAQQRVAAAYVLVQLLVIGVDVVGNLTKSSSSSSSAGSH